jgi:PAS domain S-box-containing protein
MLSETLIKNISDAVLVVDNAMRIVEVNEPACRYLRMKRDDLIGKRPKEVVTQPEPERIGHFWERLMNGETIQGQLPALREDGQVLNIEYKAFPNVAPDRHMVIFREVSGQRRFEAQTQAFLKLGRQLSAARTAQEAARIITGVADELLGWDACFLDLYSAETDTTESLLTIDTLDGKRREVPPTNFGAPTLIERKTITEGKRLIHLERGKEFEGVIIVGEQNFEHATLMFVPVRDGEQVIGVFSIQKYSAKAYTYDDLDTLQALADYCGGSFHRIQGEALLAISKNRLEVVREIEQAILEARSPEEIANAALFRIADIITFDRGSVYLFSGAPLDAAPDAFFDGDHDDARAGEGIAD